MTDNPIKVLEKQSGLIRMLIYLFSHAPINVQAVVDSTDIYPNIMYASLRKARELSLIEERVDKTSYPYKTVISLTEKGMKVAEHLKAIEEILKK